VRVLLDKSVPTGLRHLLAGHDVRTAEFEQWGELKNGKLLAAAEQAGFEVFVTSDQDIKFQQNLQDRKIAVVVLGTNKWRLIRVRIAEILAVVNSGQPGSYAFLDFREDHKRYREAEHDQ
jgi:hypothetical protein